MSPSLKLGTEKSKRKFHRIFFSTDVHASEIVFRKFISAASFYEVDILVMGGDITGKTVAPVVEDADRKYYFNFQGQEFDQVPANDLQNLEKRIMNAGMYPYRVSQSEYEMLQADPPKVSALFERLMVERLTLWASLAEENLAPLGVRCYWTGGNDDRQEALDSVSSTEHFVNVDEKVITLETGHEMLSLGWSNLTPWKTPRECDEDELAAKLGPLTGQVLTPLSCIFNVHAPPFDSNLDIAPKLDVTTDPPKPVVEGDQPVLIPVGSTTVRNTIDKMQPLLMLCGHIRLTGDLPFSICLHHISVSGLSKRLGRKHLRIQLCRDKLRARNGNILGVKHVPFEMRH